MKTIVSNKQNWFNKIKLTKDDKVYVGIDVHKKSYAVAGRVKLGDRLTYTIDYNYSNNLYITRTNSVS